MPKSVFITGANTGIGFQVVRALYSSSNESYHILLGSRSLSNAHKAIEAIKTEFPTPTNNIITPVQIDIEDDTSIQSAHDTISSLLDGGKLDVLVNNAGAQLEHELISGKIGSERELWDKSWSVNTTSTQVVTSKFIPLLLRSDDPRLLFVTSATASFAGTANLALKVNQPPETKGWPKPGFVGIPAYRSAKTGLNMMMHEWHRLLKEDGVKVFALSPGLLATGLGGDSEFLKKMGAEDPSVAGPFVKSVIEGERDADVGKVVSRAGVQGW